MRVFNTTGSCSPDVHYMVDISNKLSKIESMVERGSYFTINRARQFGKTTTIDALNSHLANRFVVAQISLEGFETDLLANAQSFITIFSKEFSKTIARHPDIAGLWTGGEAQTLSDIADSITHICTNAGRPIVLMIDEVDQISDNQVFMSFLGMLRRLYLARAKEPNCTFHSVILSGVHDIKNLKVKLRPDEERRYNSPWNIAADFKVDMSFSPSEIATMLADYESEHNTGMDIEAMSGSIHKYTSGYPYLVSKICEIIECELDRDWSEEGIRNAIKGLVRDGHNTLLGDIIKNIETYPEFERMMRSMLVEDCSFTFDPNVTAISLGLTFSAVREDEHGRLAVHNLVFESKLYNYFTSKLSLSHTTAAPFDRSSYVDNGRLNMERTIDRFLNLMREEYRKEDEQFLERQGRLLFLCFLKPIINGKGFYYVEPQTRENSRMDLIVTYGGEEFVIELKIWRGTRYETDGKAQLASYLDTRGLTRGYLLTFSFLKEKQQVAPEWTEVDGKMIYEAIV